MQGDFSCIKWKDTIERMYGRTRGKVGERGRGESQEEEGAVQSELQVIHSTALLTPSPAHSHLPSRHTGGQRFPLILFF